MKSTIITALLCILAIGAKAQIILVQVNNNTACTQNVQLIAYDPSCHLTQTSAVVPFTVNSVQVLSTTTSGLWSPALPAGWVILAATVVDPNPVCSGASTTVGTGCSGFSSPGSFICPCGTSPTRSVTWTPLSGGEARVLIN